MSQRSLPSIDIMVPQRRGLNARYIQHGSPGSMLISFGARK